MNICLIGGGTGTFTLLSSLKKTPCTLSVIVSTADDGGSSGVLRSELGVIPMGDLRQCLSGLGKDASVFARAFNYRFETGFLKGHVMGNILLAALQKVSGDCDEAVSECGRLLSASGLIIPVTREATTLSARLDDGTVITGEHAIDEPRHDGSRAIASLSLTPLPAAHPQALEAIQSADAIIFGPGDLYTSILPNLVVPGVADAVRESSASKILVTNLMTKHGQTNGFSASGFLSAIEVFLGEGVISTVIVNTKRPTQEWIEQYRSVHSEWVEPDRENLIKKGVEVVAGELLSENIFSKSCADPLTRSFLRHDSDKTAQLIWTILSHSSPVSAIS